MPIYWDGAANANPTTDLLTLIETTTDTIMRHPQAVALGYSGAVFPASATTNYLYSDEIVTPPIFVGGSRLRFPRPGCRPRMVRRTGSNVPGTWYINRFTDGEVWVSQTANSRTGTQISWPSAGTTLPRGIRYATVSITGGGGGGGCAGTVTSAGGGGGGATAISIIRLPANGYATIVIGGGGGGGAGTGLTPGGDGGASTLTCGSYTVTAGGGIGGIGGTNGTNTVAGGVASGGLPNADGRRIGAKDGSIGYGRRTGGGSNSYTFPEHAPEATPNTWSANNGTSTDSAGRGGGGGASILGAGGRGGDESAGGNGTAPGGGGGGGGNKNWTYQVGGAGAAGGFAVYY